MVSGYVGFAPLGVVLVMVLGVGVAEHSGLVSTGLKKLLDHTPVRFLTPMLAAVSIASHAIADAAFVAVVPLGGVLFYAAGRHPLAGLVVAFCGVGGAFAANFLPSGLDPLLQGFTEPAAQIMDPSYQVNPLCNWFFMAFAAVFLVLGTWYVTDRIVEPRLAGVPIDGDPDELPEFHGVTPREVRALWLTLAVSLVMVVGLVLAVIPADSPLRGEGGSLTARDAPIMQAIVPIMFLFTVFPGMTYGYAAGTFKSHKDVIKGMSESMSSMGYYMVLVFFAAMFTKAFADSNLGALLALKGAAGLKALGLPSFVIILGIGAPVGPSGHLYLPLDQALLDPALQIRSRGTPHRVRAENLLRFLGQTILSGSNSRASSSTERSFCSSTSSYTPRFSSRASRARREQVS